MNAISAIQQAGKSALITFEQAIQQPQSTQQRILQQIIENNVNSAFGQRHHFAAIRHYRDFAERLPIGDYTSHRQAIARLAAGEAGLLTSAPVRLFEETGGSTSGAKLIPYTDDLLAAFRRAILPWLGDLLRRRPQALQGKLFFVISPLTRTHHHTQGGLPIGSGDDLAYLGAEMGALIAAQTLFLPELLNAQTAAKWQWQCARLLLTTPDLTLISAWSPTLILAILRTLHHEQDSLLATVEDRHQRARMTKALAGSHPDTRLLWPQLDTVSCWTSHTAAAPAAELQNRLPHAHIQGKGLLATEGVTSIPFADNPYPLLTVNSHFYEFIDETGNIFRAHELQEGSRYRIILTTQGGLYRYNTGDQVEICAIEEQVPRLTFIGRNDLHSDICGEKLNEAFVRQAMQQTDAKLARYCLLQGFIHPAAHYRLIAANTAQQWLSRNIIAALEQALSANPQYAYAQRIGQLGTLQVLWVDNIADYSAQFIRDEQRLGTRKTPLLLPVK